MVEIYGVIPTRLQHFWYATSGMPLLVCHFWYAISARDNLTIPSDMKSSVEKVGGMLRSRDRDDRGGTATDAIFLPDV